MQGALSACFSVGALFVSLALPVDPVASAGQPVARMAGAALADWSAVGVQLAALLVGAAQDLARVKAGAVAVDVDLANQALEKERKKILIKRCIN